MKSLPLILLLAFLIAFGRNSRADNARPELRAFWADGFNDGYKTPQQVDQLLQRLHDAHCNAIFAQMRKRGDAYYPSHYEPWASDDTQHFDALAYLIEKAHAMNPPIAVHAWINTCAVGGDAKNPFNIVHLHPDWLSLDPKNDDFDKEATKIDPGNPDAADWTFRIYLDVVRHYPNVDGIHFDFVRYGGASWGYNPVSVARFNQQFGDRADIKRIPDTDLPAPDDPAWMQWRRDQVTNLVRKVFAHAMAVDPKVIVSGSLIAWSDGPHNEEEWFTKSAAMNRVFQDWQSWLQEGIIDLACPMTYFQAEYHTDYQKDWAEFIKDHQYHRVATVAVGNWMNTIPQTLSLMQIARAPSEKGNLPYGIMLYSYAGTNASEEKPAKGPRAFLSLQPEFYACLGQPSSYAAEPPFPTDVPIPPMDWKLHPKEGHIKGFIFTSRLDPVDGATVTLRRGGKTLTRAADGSGFYAFVNLASGDYTLRVSAPGFEPQDSKAQVTAGQVTTVPFTLGGATVPRTPSMLALYGNAAHSPAGGTPVRLEKLTVTIGSDTFPGNLYVTDAHGAGIRVRLAQPPILPFQPGDVVSVNGTLATVDGEPAIDQATARLTDMLPMSVLPAPTAMTGQNLLATNTTPGAVVQVRGKVTESSAAGFVLDDNGTRIEVPLAGRKDFGVEATGFSVTPPAVGANVAVTGIAVVATGDGNTHIVRLRIRDANDVQPLPATASSLMQNPYVGGAALAVALTLPVTITLRRRSRTRG
ncbi:MAG TPA: family 10 glycosylhydrolase [Chthonomonadaceae bacterium]|nr:family 10 glycosylhydrolase [Chthonomonadaceae bacterium]